MLYLYETAVVVGLFAVAAGLYLALGVAGPVVWFGAACLALGLRGVIHDGAR